MKEGCPFKEECI